jgi:hypothetical protein
MIGWQKSEGLRICVHCIDKALGESCNRFFVLKRALDDLVINVGDIANLAHLIAASSQPASHHIKYDHHTRMA